jgi:hypothetical protein
MFLGLFCEAIVTVLLFPETATAKLLKRFLVELPALHLAALTLRRALLGLVLIVAVAAFAQAFSADLVWLVAGDVTAYVEVVAAVWFIAAGLRARSALKQMATAAREAQRRTIRSVIRMRGTVRSRRTRRAVIRPAKDDDAAGLVFAFA